MKPKKRKRTERGKSKCNGRFSLSILFPLAKQKAKAWVFKSNRCSCKFYSKYCNTCTYLLAELVQAAFFLSASLWTVSKPNTNHKLVKPVGSEKVWDANSSWKATPSWNPLIHKSVENFFFRCKIMVFLREFPKPRLWIARIAANSLVFDWFC